MFVGACGAGCTRGAMSDVVLDTHACVFALTAPERLGAAARKLLKACESGRGTALIPAVVVAEIVLLRELGRIGLGLPELRTALARTPALRFLQMDLAQLDEFSALTAIREPFDRFIVSAARAVDATLLTKDRGLADSGLVRVAWS